jgi:hypothetical protein
MKEQMHEILMNLNRGRIAVSEAQEQLLDLFSVSKRHLLESILEDCKHKYSEHHSEIVESYLEAIEYED